jgi:hypothetical protein
LFFDALFLLAPPAQVADVFIGDNAERQGYDYDNDSE